tara:strand:+ start:131 stop:595 length:465 start_codon:yes stop_codon:yes gene_type:complete
MEESNEPRPKPLARQRSSKRQVVKDTLVFQVKLFGDGMRDVFLSPVSIMAAVAGLLFSPSKPDYYLRKLMAFGHKTDRWLNLFGTHSDHSASTKNNSDAYVKKVEDILLKGKHAAVSSANTDGSDQESDNAQQSHAQQKNVQGEVRRQEPTSDQ